MTDINRAADEIHYSGNPSNLSMVNSTSAQMAEVISLPDTTYIYVTVTIFYVVVFFFGVLGNTLVIYVVCVLKDMRTPTNIFLVNLSLADLLVLLVCMPSAIVEFLARDIWLLGSLMCKLTSFLENAVSHTSILTILSISFERYYAICSPLEVLYACSRRRSLFLITIVWICGLLSALPMLFFTFTVETDHVYKGTVQVCTTPIHGLLRLSYVFIKLLILFVAPGIILIVLYTMICQKLVGDKPADSINNTGTSLLCHTPTSASSQMHCTRAFQARKQIIYMLITIIILFFVCLLPFRVFTLWSIFSSKHDKEKLGLDGYLHLISFSRIMFYLNSAVNPLLYNIMSTKFRDACRRALSCRCLIKARQDKSHFSSTRVWAGNATKPVQSDSTEMEMVNVKEDKLMVTLTSKGVTTQLLTSDCNLALSQYG